ncbi:hypothetical protein GALMADRAFT_228372 [Galerina marginata CBS 339.88]|uniref:Uncharacterized protein n=1 Tax=Galerina marginata (strain CBS 339.88) TaxID=685588 RepID=A0A067SQN6_GALM3|nr:hypothetical protein GALMADRAFT_228372 [Galerina marginata CBS 339.88]
MGLVACTKGKRDTTALCRQLNSSLDEFVTISVTVADCLSKCKATESCGQFPFKVRRHYKAFKSDRKAGRIRIAVISTPHLSHSHTPMTIDLFFGFSIFFPMQNILWMGSNVWKNKVWYVWGTR